MWINSLKSKNIQKGCLGIEGQNGLIARIMPKISNLFKNSNKIDFSSFENTLDSEELKEICKDAVNNGTLKIDEEGKIIGIYVDVSGEKRPSNLFNSLVKLGLSPEQALKSRLQVRTRSFKNWFGDWESVVSKPINTDTVGGSPVALSYLLEGGPNTIKNTSYLLHGISAAFELLTSNIENIRSMYLGKFDENPSNFINDTTGALQEIKNIIEKTYGQQGLNILNDILCNATGFLAKEGKKIQNRLDELNTTIGNAQSKSISKVVDENGEPLLVYHGSPRRFENFDTDKIGSTTGDKSGFYFSNNKEVAKSYYSKETGSVLNNFKLMLGVSKEYKSTVYACFIRAINPYIYDFGGDVDKIGREKLIADAKNAGHDSAILKNIIDGPSVVQDVYIAFTPDQIKIEVK